jgi:hypothetical protein
MEVWVRRRVDLEEVARRNTSSPAGNLNFVSQLISRNFFFKKKLSL